MKKRTIKKLLITLLSAMVIGFLPNISGISVIKNNPLIGEVMLFEDDFNDNIKDYDKWTEIMSDGEWYETNQRTEFKVYEKYNTNNEAVLGKDFTAFIDTENKLYVTFKMITYIDHYYGYVGEMSGQVKDKNGNGIATEYRRGSNDFQILDTAGTDMTLFNSFESSVPWDVTFEIYSDRYKIICEDFDSGWIYKSIFSGETTFNFRMLAAATGDYPFMWWKCGFDEVRITGDKGGSGGSGGPDIPNRPSGVTKGLPGEEYTYSTYTTHPNDETVYYKWDWADEYSDWIGPYESGETIYSTHTWANQGIYRIRVKAKDVNNNESEWSDPLVVTMPRNHEIFHSIFEQIIQHFLLLRTIIGLY
jgi:hypothetical protein